MSDHAERAMDLMTAIKIGGGAGTAGIGLAQVMEIVQGGLAIVASVVGISFTVYMFIKEIKKDRSKRKSDKGG